MLPFVVLIITLVIFFRGDLKKKTHYAGSSY